MKVHLSLTNLKCTFKMCLDKSLYKNTIENILQKSIWYSFTIPRSWTLDELSIEIRITLCSVILKLLYFTNCFSPIWNHTLGSSILLVGKKDHNLSYYYNAKGQLISKGLFWILNSSKKWTKKFDLTTMKPQINLFSFIF